MAGPKWEATVAVANRGGREAEREVAGHSQGQGGQARGTRRGDRATNCTGIPFCICNSVKLFFYPKRAFE